MTLEPSPFDGANGTSATIPRRSSSEFFRKYFLAGQKKADESSISSSGPSPFDKLVAQHRKLIGIATPFIFVQTIYWLLAWRNGFYALFPLRYEMALVMMFGAAVGGATAEGGGAIAFPVLTLAFHVPPTIARDFAVMIQTVGMNSAAVSVQLMGLMVEMHTMIFASIGGAAGTIVSLEEKKRVTFDRIENFGLSKALVLFAVGFVGGERNVFEISKKHQDFSPESRDLVATPTTVSLAGINSAVAFFWRHQIQHAIQPLAWEYFAVCVPVVSVFGPIGALLSSHLHRQTLAVLIYVLETVALISAVLIIRPGFALISHFHRSRCLCVLFGGCKTGRATGRTKDD